MDTIAVSETCVRFSLLPKANSLYFPGSLGLRDREEDSEIYRSKRFCHLLFMNGKKLCVREAEN